ncbi:hypothetical protein NDU88_008323 [Pleurodeles waltl]|uniref:Uncharacterized protein n=1 Tax=Pleurodeles waltl TaxID=8319 RepID=A0AAV7P3C5_PLEWA|nr:hypothetical protein NDU88_008323 [Pleurodeles waltl]
MYAVKSKTLRGRKVKKYWQSTARAYLRRRVGTCGTKSSGRILVGTDPCSRLKKSKWE